MSKKKEKLSKNKLIIIILLVASATVITSSYISKIEESKANQVDAIIATKDIKDGSIITREMLAVSKIPKEYLLQNTAINTDLIIGRTAVIPIFQGEQIVIDKLTETKKTPEKNSWVLPINPIDKALDLNENTFVDIWLVPTTKGIENGQTAKVFFKGIKIQKIKNEAYYTQAEIPKAKDGSSPIFIPEYLIFNLSTEETQSLANINPIQYSFRITRYNEALLAYNLEGTAEGTLPILFDGDNTDSTSTEEEPQDEFEIPEDEDNTDSQLKNIREENANENN